MYDGGKEVIVDEISDKTLMEKISETAYQKYIYPRHFFGLPADAEIEATYFHFTNEDRSIVVTDPASGEDFLVSETVEYSPPHTRPKGPAGKYPGTVPSAVFRAFSSS